MHVAYSSDSNNLNTINSYLKLFEVILTFMVSVRSNKFKTLSTIKIKKQLVNAILKR